MKTVQGMMNYHLDDDRTRHLTVHYPATGERIVNYEMTPVQCHVRDARPFVESLSVDTNGFVLRKVDSKCNDFTDDKKVQSTYYPEAQKMIKAEFPGVQHVIIFDHTVRTQNGRRTFVTEVHADYTQESGLAQAKKMLQKFGAQQLPELTPAQQTKLLEGHLGIANIWKPINHTAHFTPLAFLDPRSVQEKDVKEIELIYPDRIGRIPHLFPSDLHDWWYFPEMTTREAVIFKQMDTREDVWKEAGAYRGHTFHSAFKDPTMPPVGAKPRESIELRCLFFWGDAAEPRNGQNERSTSCRL